MIIGGRGDVSVCLDVNRSSPCGQNVTVHGTKAKLKIGKASLVLISIIKQEMETKDKDGEGERTIKMPKESVKNGKSRTIKCIYQVVYNSMKNINIIYYIVLCNTMFQKIF